MSDDAELVEDTPVHERCPLCNTRHLPLSYGGRGIHAELEAIMMGLKAGFEISARFGDHRALRARVISQTFLELMVLLDPRRRVEVLEAYARTHARIEAKRAKYRRVA